MDQETCRCVGVLWDYMHMNMELRPADAIVGFGCYNIEIALRAAELYHEGFSPLVVFTGGLGRNTKQMWNRSEAEIFQEAAVKAGVPEKVIILEKNSTNTGENIRFTKRLLEGRNICSIIGIHKPFMERRLFAAMGVYWPEISCIVTSPRDSIEEYIRRSEEQGIGEARVIEILTGDFQRIDAYARRGYQIPQQIPEEAWEAFRMLRSRGYTRELI